MPVIVIGADTPVGDAIVDLVLPSAAEVRAFVSDGQRARDLRDSSVKVALGDVSDPSHVEAAALNCFCAVLVVEAATDGRERAFAADPQAVIEGWAGAIRNAGVQRAIWVAGEGSRLPLPRPVPEVATVTVGRYIEGAAREVAELEGVHQLPD